MTTSPQPSVPPVVPCADPGDAAGPERIRVQTRRPLPPRRRRVMLAYGYLTAVAATAASALLLGPGWAWLAQLIGVVALAALWFALRTATRLAVDAPQEALAELQSRLRNQLYVLSYQLLGAVTVMVSAVLFIASRGGVAEPVAIALAWVCFGCALGLPLVVAAVALPDTVADGVTGD